MLNEQSMDPSTVARWLTMMKSLRAINSPVRQRSRRGHKEKDASRHNSSSRESSDVVKNKRIAKALNAGAKKVETSEGSRRASDEPSLADADDPEFRGTGWDGSNTHDDEDAWISWRWIERKFGDGFFNVGTWDTPETEVFGLQGHENNSGLVYVATGPETSARHVKIVMDALSYPFECTVNARSLSYDEMKTNKATRSGKQSVEEVDRLKRFDKTGGLGFTYAFWKVSYEFHETQELVKENTRLKNMEAVLRKQIKNHAVTEESFMYYELVVAYNRLVATRLSFETRLAQQYSLACSIKHHFLQIKSNGELTKDYPGGVGTYNYKLCSNTENADEQNVLALYSDFRYPLNYSDLTGEEVHEVSEIVDAEDPFWKVRRFFNCARDIEFIF